MAASALSIALVSVVGGVCSSALAQNVQLQVTVENLAPTNGVTFAPLRVGFHSGVFDAFDNGSVAPLLGESDVSTAPIVTIAEGGSGSSWFPAFEAADPTATLGSVVSDPAGPLTPGAVATATFNIDTDLNQFFTFAAMVVPSNDLFIGNDDPQGFRLFDDAGNLLISEITQTGAQIWDAGSEVADPSAGAFVVGGDNALRTNENGVVSFEFSELGAFDGVETPAGYFFDAGTVTGSSEIYRISFAVVPAPAGAGVLAMGGLVAMRRRR
ncbi:MAG: PEP-CTERM sorting domain-containing protein [Phycisphaerae bacterium]|nr:PEP-CTERM sorting domain-containing protein [Phycisphaerae bacterium]